MSGPWTPCRNRRWRRPRHVFAGRARGAAEAVPPPLRPGGSGSRRRTRRPSRCAGAVGARDPGRARGLRRCRHARVRPVVGLRSAASQRRGHRTELGQGPAAGARTDDPQHRAHRRRQHAQRCDQWLGGDSDGDRRRGRRRGLAGGRRVPAPAMARRCPVRCRGCGARGWWLVGRGAGTRRCRAGGHRHRCGGDAQRQLTRTRRSRRSCSFR
jgi:hypothetical protein